VGKGDYKVRAGSQRGKGKKDEKTSRGKSGDLVPRTGGAHQFWDEMKQKNTRGKETWARLGAGGGRRHGPPHWGWEGTSSHPVQGQGHLENKEPDWTPVQRSRRTLAETLNTETMVGQQKNAQAQQPSDLSTLNVRRKGTPKSGCACQASDEKKAPGRWYSGQSQKREGRSQW